MSHAEFAMPLNYLTTSPISIIGTSAGHSTLCSTPWTVTTMKTALTELPSKTLQDRQEPPGDPLQPESVSAAANKDNPPLGSQVDPPTGATMGSAEGPPTQSSPLNHRMMMWKSMGSWCSYLVIEERIFENVNRHDEQNKPPKTRLADQPQASNF